MRLYIVLFAIGAWLLQREAELPPMQYAWLLLLIAPAYALTRLPSRRIRNAAVCALAMLSLVAGFYWAAALAHIRLADELPAVWEGRDIEVIGVVASLPQPYERSVRFDLDVERVLTPGARVPGRISVSWWGRSRDGVAELPRVSAGERWR
jgi:competence protein ComEC